MDVSVRWTEPSGRQTAATLCPTGPSEWSLPIQLSDILGERIFEIEAVDATVTAERNVDHFNDESSFDR
jgi:hypothetical protein